MVSTATLHTIPSKQLRSSTRVKKSILTLHEKHVGESTSDLTHTERRRVARRLDELARTLRGHERAWWQKGIASDVW